MDARLVHSLIALPEAVVGQTPIPEHHSLAVRDLLRGRALDLPSGEALAEAMGVEPLSEEELGLTELGLGWQGETPLWYYVLKEAELTAGAQHLGAVGGRIVAEVMIGLMQLNPDSYLAADRSWTPQFGGGSDFKMVDLLKMAGVVNRA
jgi:hypothetical protein